MSVRAATAAVAFALLCSLAAPASIATAALDAGDATWDGSQPPQGVFFHWYEPSFYTGFAPRTQDPSRVHIELSRGNQVRVTLVVGETEIDAYLDDLEQRHEVYQQLIDTKVIELSVNRQYELFVQRLREVDVSGAIVARAKLGRDGYRQKSVEILSTLNPERVFRIHIPLDTLAARWHAALLAADLASAAGRLDAANAILPGRLNLTELATDADASLSSAADAARSGDPDAPAFRSAAQSFLERTAAGHYRIVGGFVDAIEFTAIYPAGTVDATTTYNGERLPDFGATGVWPLMRREQGRGITGMVDYLSNNPGYGFIPLLAYQHAGGISYNAFHNAGVRCQLGSTSFLPKEWNKTTSERDGKPFQNLWIVSRGPTSHGCTRLASGHMSELRQIVPTESEALTRIPTFRNLPQCYDVFDLRGDGTREVMGVQYYLAYKSLEHTPVRAYISNRRDAFYHWLYGDNVALGEVGRTRIKSVPVCRFAGRKALEAATLRDLPLHEAKFTPETIQFYRIKPASFESARGFEFNREIRKIGAGHPLDRKVLFLK